MSRRARIYCVSGAALAVAGAIAALLATRLPGRGDAAPSTACPPGRVVVLGIDGMDYGVTRRLLQAGRLSNFAALAREGSFHPVQTTMPPLSPVAWSTFITGADPGRHGVYDFLSHRYADVGPGLAPGDAVAELRPPDAEPRPIPLTDYVLSPPRRHALRRAAPPFWDLLTDRGIPATVYKIPANYPVPESEAAVLAGMGTPDVEGTYGTFTLLTTRRSDWARRITGGRIVRTVLRDGQARVLDKHEQSVRPRLIGPVNPFLRRETPAPKRRVRAGFDVYLDAPRHTAAVRIQGRDIVLAEGEWSDWVPIRFELLGPLETVRGQIRLYLQEAGEHLRLFVSPVHLAPGAPGLASSGLDQSLAEAIGPYYTKGMSEQTKALTAGVFTPREYATQSHMVLAERLEAIDHLLRTRGEGLLFLYVSTLDLDQHVMWRHQDPNHPAHDEQQARRHSEHIERRYVEMDRLLGRVRKQLGPRDVLYVLSDHGFASFHREVNLLRWLQREGYLVYESPVHARVSELYSHIDWERTRAYPVGFNGLYINTQGREPHGPVTPAQAGPLIEEIRRKLLALRDSDGQAVFSNVYRPGEVYSPPARGAPDLLLGYAGGYGPSDDSVLGTWRDRVLASHENGYSGHHAVDYREVPGVLFTDRPLSADSVRLQDVTVTILSEFGVAPTDRMTGKNLR